MRATESARRAVSLAACGGILLGAIFLTGGCATAPKQPKEYYVKAYRPSNPNDVRVKVSVRNQAIYVVENGRPLLVAACCVGRPETPTPLGTYRIYKKEANRRRISNPGSGYPMGYWCEFKSAYGIHAGWVHPAPRTHGCIRLHFNAAPKFFALVKEGTPVDIRLSHPEDGTLGANLERPQDFNDPEFPPHILNTDRIFHVYNGPLFDG